jgi:CrcB protein
MKWLWIGAGGAFGSVARYLLDALVQRCVPGPFPVGTLLVNVLGSFALGLLWVLLEARGALDSTLRFALVAGVLGGFTTYSSFNQQTLELVRARAWTMAGLYLTGTLGLCILAGSLGTVAGRWMSQP